MTIPLPELPYFMGPHIRDEINALMRAYGDARAAEERERCAALVESRAGPLRTGAYDALIAAAAAIRDLLAAAAAAAVDKP